MASFGFMHRVRQVRDLLRRDGFFSTLATIWRRLRHGPVQWSRINVFRHYEFIQQRQLKLTPSVAKANTLLWFIPDFNVGSGGHLNIFRTIWHLEQMGYESNIAVIQPSVHLDAESAKKDINEHFFPLRAKVFLGEAGLPNCEFVVATSWHTTYSVRSIVNDVKKIYFVQDYEPWFYPVGSEFTLANNTYHFDFFGITAGNWLASKLAKEYGMRTHPVRFGVELDRYRRLPRREPEIRRVFFYARPPTSRRAFELGLLVLNEVSRRLPSTEFVLAGWDCSAYEIPFPHLNAGTVSMDELPDLFSQCDVALVLSLTNLSLMPLELMACGCPVVSNRGENVEWLLNDDVAILTEPTPEALASAICGLLTDEEARRALSIRGEAFARTQTWDSVAKEFEIGLQMAREPVRCAA